MKINREGNSQDEVKHAMQTGATRAMKNLVLYFAGKVSDLQDVKLNKLLYIAHLYHYATHGELLTMTRFFCRTFGPYAPVLRLVVQEVLDSQQIYLANARTSEDPTYSNPCMVIRSHFGDHHELPAACLLTLGQVLEDWGTKRFQNIVDYTNRTIPFLSTHYREQIDWALYFPSSGLKEVLPLEQRFFIHRFVDAVDDLGWKEMAIEKGGGLTIQEIAEIYLALRGDNPQAFPAAGHLGFDGQKIIEVCEIVNSRRPDGEIQETNIIDLAAKLINSLIESMAFRQYTGKVALLAAMLFLLKQGYSLRDDAIEQFWLQDVNYDNIRQWLMRLID